MILSEKGWVRAAKGHEIDPTTLSYKAGDQFKALAKGKSNQVAIFFDCAGQAFSIPAHTLASARGQGEPLTGRVKSTAGGFDAVVIGNPEQKVLLACDNGYGFIAKLEDVQTKNKNGKAVIKVPTGGHVLSIYPVNDVTHDNIIAVTNIGRLLMFKADELPELAKGKGNKIIDVPTKKYESKEEFVIDVIVVPAKTAVTLLSGNRKLTLSAKDLQNYLGKRAQRGNNLPKGYQRVTSIKVE